MIRFLHAADLHLDSPFKGITDMPAARLAELRESTFAAYQSFITYAVREQPDFILLAGDIYDGEDRSLRAQMRFISGLEQLREAGIPVFLLYGNHDHLAGSWARFKVPDNVTVFGPDVESHEFTVRGQRVAVHGFSYPERHVSEAMIARYPEASGGTLHIGMLHGSIAGDDTHAVYAPFTMKELLQKKYDYWALGHIHKRQLLHEGPPVVYPGNLQGRHRNEAGVKGFYDVVLDDGDAQLTFVPTSVVRFEEIQVDCSDIRHANDWLAKCREQAEEAAGRSGSAIVRVVNRRIGEEARELFAGAPAEEWLDILRETADSRIWFSGLAFEASALTGAAGSSPLIRSVIERLDGWTDGDWKEVLQDVYQHARSAPFLDTLDDRTKQQVKESAGSLLTDELTS
ncbi:DNA repair exonuclease [Sporosarcina sp. NCCP-2716]|uniref:metallophosphoesterase family protein n=1 Tax=Sporosarcina sp. NCCP-2716 TaxID=2943679 RepID=UPI00203D93EF|nr:DNA repair exonuclease [Sporosarcina sp. NCCP-2716]GKV69899.1 DNA repair exonuclease [Sporosarcina sp. NCCP-2716]